MGRDNRLAHGRRRPKIVEIDASSIDQPVTMDGSNQEPVGAQSRLLNFQPAAQAEPPALPPMQADVPNALRYAAPGPRTIIAAPTTSGYNLRNRPAAVPDDSHGAVALYTAFHISPNEVPSSWQSAMSSPDASAWLDAAKSEMDSLADNGTFSVCELPHNRTPVGTRWVFALKHNVDGTVARY